MISAGANILVVGTSSVYSGKNNLRGNIEKIKTLISRLSKERIAF